MNFADFIGEDYRYNLYLDGLPAAVRLRNKETGELELNYHDGIPVGFKDDYQDKFFVYNHLHMEVKYNKVSEKIKQIVGFVIEPRSVEY